MHGARMELQGTIQLSCDVTKTARLLQLCGMFDLSHITQSSQSWEIKADLPDDWSVGAIVGPSGCGKSTVLRHFWANDMLEKVKWRDDHAIVDDFPSGVDIKTIAELLSSVGLSSPPSWKKPFRVLSNGEQFRVECASAMCRSANTVVLDEFSSVVDRQVAQVCSAAVARTIRRRKQRLVIASCHYDILNWLQPDWVFEPHINRLARDRLQRPRITLQVKQVDRVAWALFAKHHYLSQDISSSSVCWCAMWNEVPVALCAVLHFPQRDRPNMKREHRLVCLPDYQGVGIGHALSESVAQFYLDQGFYYSSITSHPGVIAHRAKSPLWKCTVPMTIRGDTMSGRWGRKRKTGVLAKLLSTRMRSSWEFVGSRR